MSSQDSSPRGRPSPSRRTVLTGLAALAGSVVLGGASARTSPAAARTATAAPRVPPLEPRASLGIDGASEAVASDDGTVVYVAVRHGFVVVDVSDPASPTVLAENRDVLGDVEGGPLTHVYDVKLSGDTLLVAGPNRQARGLKGFALFDVSTPDSPRRLGYYETEHPIHNAFIDGDVAYLTAGLFVDNPVVFVDVADPADPSELARFTPADVGAQVNIIHDVYVQDDTLYAAYWDAGTWLADVSDPANPTPTAALGFDVNAVDTNTFELPGNSHYVQPNADGSLVAVGEEAWDDPNTDPVAGPGGVELWSMAGEPELLTILAPPDDDPTGERNSMTAHNFGWRGERLYTSWYDGGVRVYDCSTPSEPTLLAEWRDPETTSFWTAISLHDGFLGSSYYDPSKPREQRIAGVGAGVFAFPEPTGEGDPAPTMDPLAPPTVRTSFGSTGGAGTTTRSRDGATAQTPTGATTEGTSDPPTTGSAGEPAGTTPPTSNPPTGGTDDTTGAPPGDQMPGFGPVAALAGAGLAGWRLRRDRDEE